MSKHWIGTSFQDKFDPEESEIQYCVAQREMCPETKKLHYQFYVEFKNRKRLTGVRKVFGSCHVEIANCPKDARNYCMKEDTRVSPPIEIGEYLTRQETTPIVKKLGKCSVLDLINNRPGLWRNLRSLQALKAAVAQPRSNLTEAAALHGDTGTGKTKIVKLIASFVGAEGTYWKDQTMWWEGYEGQALVVWDEFRPQHSTVAQLLSLINHIPHRVPIKGSSAQFVSPWVLFTSNVDPKDWYGMEDSKSIAALMRRIKSYELK